MRLDSGISGGFHRWCTLLAGSVLLLAGCAATAPPTITQLPLADQAIYYPLTHAGVDILRLGDELRIRIPARKLFIPNSLRLKPDSHVLLDRITAILNRTENSGIRVTAVSDCTGLRCGAASAEQQALIVVDLLARHGLNARLLYPTARTVSIPARRGLWRAGHFVPTVEIATHLLHPEDME